MGINNWQASAADRLVKTAEQIGHGVAGLPDAINGLAKSIDNIAKAYAQANPSEDRK